MSKIFRYFRNNEGFAMALTMVVVLVVTVLGITLWQVGTKDVLHVERDENSAQAYYYARSGVEAAVGLIMEHIKESNDYENADNQYFYGKLGDTSFAKQPTDDYNIQFRIERKVPDPKDIPPEDIEPKDIKFYIESIGIVRQGGVAGTQISSNALGFIISLEDLMQSMKGGIGSGYGGPWALFAMGDVAVDKVISLKNSITGNVGTNSTIPTSIKFQNKHDQIKGSLYVGTSAIAPESIVSYPNNTNIEDHITKMPIKNLPTYINYPMPLMPVFPNGLPERTDISTNQGYDIYGSGQYDRIKAKDLTFDLTNGDMEVRVRDLDVNNSIKLKCDNNNKNTLTLYVENTLNFKDIEGSDNNNLIIYYNGSKDININGNHDFTCSMFINSANISVSGNCEIKGTIICGGDSVRLSGGKAYGNNKKALEGLLYAPNAHVEIGSIVHGSVITKSCELGGGSSDLIVGVSKTELNTEFFNSLNWGVDGPPSLFSPQEVVSGNEWRVWGQWKNL